MPTVENALELPAPLSEWLAPLSAFLDQNQIRQLKAGVCAPEAMPQPYRQLLAHKKDMTSTLEGFHKVVLRVHANQIKKIDGDYWREVTLRCAFHQKAVEFGIIRIHIDRLDEAGQKLALDGKVPFGAILNGLKIPYKSEPAGFFWLDSIPEIEKALDMESPSRLWGRRNTLSQPDGEPLAEILEILPPMEETSCENGD